MLTKKKRWKVAAQKGRDDRRGLARRCNSLLLHLRSVKMSRTDENVVQSVS